MKKLISTMALALILAPAAGALAGDMAGMDMGGKDKDMKMDTKPAAAAPASPTAAEAAKVKPAKKGKKAKKSKSEAAESWTCPMHPEVHEKHAGKCPKCGMDLVKEAPKK